MGLPNQTKPNQTMFNVISSGHANVLSVGCKTLPMLALKRRCYHGVPLASQSSPNSKPVLGGYQLLNVPAGIGIGSSFYICIPAWYWYWIWPAKCCKVQTSIGQVSTFEHSSWYWYWISLKNSYQPGMGIESPRSSGKLLTPWGGGEGGDRGKKLSNHVVSIALLEGS
jgi:hypothetical protein